MLPAKFGSIWPSCFRGEDFFNISQSKKELILVAMFVGRMEPNEEALVWVHFCQAVSEEKIFLNSSQSETRISLAVIFVGGTERNGEAL